MLTVHRAGKLGKKPSILLNGPLLFRVTPACLSSHQLATCASQPISIRLQGQSLLGNDYVVGKQDKVRGKDSIMISILHMQDRAKRLFKNKTKE